MGKKATLRECAEGGNTYLLIYCMNHWVGYGGCWHSARFSLVVAFMHWPAGVQIDDLPFRCTRCGSANIDVRADMPSQPRGGNPRWPSIAHAWPPVDCFSQTNPRSPSPAYGSPRAFARGA